MQLYAMDSKVPSLALVIPRLSLLVVYVSTIVIIMC